MTTTRTCTRKTDDDRSVSADVESSSDRYAARFAGASGSWMLRVQERIARQFIGSKGTDASVLDIGGGHGQLAIPLSRSGFDITVLGSDATCARQIQPLLDEGRCRYVTGNLLEPPFEPGSFDIAISFRMLTHCVHWESLIDALCHMARHRVIIDYPTNQSVNCFAPLFFRMKQRIEQHTRPWRSFRHSEITREFSRYGFEPAGIKKQFFFPMVLHRMLKCRPVSVAAEAAFRCCGLTALLGSPVIAHFKRDPTQ